MKMTITSAIAACGFITTVLAPLTASAETFAFSGKGAYGSIEGFFIGILQKAHSKIWFETAKLPVEIPVMSSPSVKDRELISFAEKKLDFEVTCKEPQVILFDLYNNCWEDCPHAF